MKVTLQQIVDAMPAMAKFSQERLPAKAAYRVAKLARKMNAEYQEFEKARRDTIKRHGQPVEGKPDQIRVPPEAAEAANAEIQGLLREEVDLEGCIPVAWADVEHLSLEPAVLADLEAFVEAPKD